MRVMATFRSSVVLLLTVAAGCAPEAEPVAPTLPQGFASDVTGRVTLDGQPLPHARVMFTPFAPGATAFGQTDDQGRYRLRISDRLAGASLGPNRVRINTIGSGQAPGGGRVELLPDVYNAQSVLIADVKPGHNEFHFELTAATANRAEPRRPPPLPPSGRMRPNIVLVVINDLGPEWIGCYGAEGVSTPHIDSLAAEGLRFRHAYCMPRDIPSRITLLTGQYPFRHGWVDEWDVPQWGQGCWFDWDCNNTIGRQLHEAGYATGIAGQWKINDFREQPDALLHHGFDHWCVWTGREKGNPPSSELFWNPFLYVSAPPSRGNPGWPETNARQYDWGTSGTYPGDFGPNIMEAFCHNFLRRRRLGRFFLYYPMTLAHAPPIPLPDAADPGDERARHLATVRYIDGQIGNLVEWLRIFGLRERTLVIVASDNGTAGGSVGRLGGRDVPAGYGTLAENGVHVPLIVSCPGLVPAGVESDCLIDFTDLFPTLCDLAGIPVPDDAVLDGHSFADVLLGEEQPDRREWILAMGSGRARFNGERVVPAQAYAERVLRDQRYKVHVNTSRMIDALYDLDTDPDERHNLLDSHRPEHLRALQKFAAVVAEFPERDATPRYSPMPAEVWAPSAVVRPRLADRASDRGG